jgi:hypothetical protein
MIGTLCHRRRLVTSFTRPSSKNDGLKHVRLILNMLVQWMYVL